MTIIPKVTTEDIRLTLNGTYNASSGSYTFWEQTISSGSVLAQINLANYWLYGTLGKDIMDSTDEIISFRVNSCELMYSCMRTVVILSGGVITDGFNWNAGIGVQQPNMLATYKNLINEFKEMAMNHFINLQPIGLTDESNALDIGSTPPSVM
jgi:hypothetical protein